jgi:hypothetical protein
MPVRSLKSDDCRVAILLHSYHLIHVNGDLNEQYLNDIANGLSPKAPAAKLRIVAKQMKEDGEIIESYYDSLSIPPYAYSLTSRGLIFAEGIVDDSKGDLLEAIRGFRSQFGLSIINMIGLKPNGEPFEDGTGLLGGSQQTIPAANRFVSRSDNEEAFNEVVTALEGVAEAVSQERSNSLFACSEHRLYVVSEIGGIAYAMRTGVARVRDLWDAIEPNNILRWLSKQAVGGVVGNYASDAIKAIIRLLRDD